MKKMKLYGMNANLDHKYNSFQYRTLYEKCIKVCVQVGLEFCSFLESKQYLIEIRKGELQNVLGTVLSG